MHIEEEYLSSVLLHCIFVACYRTLISWLHTFHANSVLGFLAHYGPSVESEIYPTQETMG